MKLFKVDSKRYSTRIGVLQYDAFKCKFSTIAVKIFWTATVQKLIFSKFACLLILRIELLRGILTTDEGHSLERATLVTPSKLRPLQMVPENPAGTQYSGNMRWVFPQRCNFQDTQGTFSEHFKGKDFLKSSWYKSCFYVKSVWFDNNKCWSFGKFQ